MLKLQAVLTYTHEIGGLCGASSARCTYLPAACNIGQIEQVVKSTDNAAWRQGRAANSTADTSQRTC